MSPRPCPFLNHPTAASSFPLRQTLSLSTTISLQAPFEQFGNKKLQCIQIKNHLGIQKKRLEFNYNETPSARLSLRNLIFSGADVTQEEKYTFAYNNITAMPGFTETTVDHWGYTRINEVSPEGRPLSTATPPTPRLWATEC